MPQTSALLTVMIAAARKAGRSLARDFGEVSELQVSKKGPGDFVSAADVRAEQIIYEALAKARPGYGFLMEERGHVDGSDKTHTWIVDPLDGTLNFLHGLGHFAVSIGLAREGELVAGVVYDVVKNELFWAEKGGGAWLGDNKRLRVAARQRLSDALVVTGIPHPGSTNQPRFLKELERVSARASGVRRYGSAALDLAYVAAGRFDAFWERALKPWDIAAGALIVREAGGVAREIDGGDFMVSGHIIAGNEAIVRELGQALTA